MKLSYRYKDTIGTSVTLHSKAPIETVYRFIIDADTPAKVVKSWGPIPGFRSYQLLDGDWQHQGARRRIKLYDASNAIEQIGTLEPSTYFDYQLSDFTNPVLKRMAKKAVGQWWFTKTAGGTRIEWRYSVLPQSPWMAPLVFLFIKLPYRRFMKASLREIARIEQSGGLSIDKG